MDETQTVSHLAVLMRNAWRVLAHYGWWDSIEYAVRSQVRSQVCSYKEDSAHLTKGKTVFIRQGASQGTHSGTAFRLDKHYP